MEKIKVGVVGVGHLGKIHAEKYARLPEAELIGVVDVDRGRCQEVAERTRCQPFCHHHDLMGHVEAVSIAVPTHSHYQITRDFFMEGVDVLLEKPIAPTVQEARQLNALAQERGVVFQIGHLERFNGVLAAMNGVLKDPFLIESYRLSPFTGRGTDVDVILDLMIHDIDIILSIMGSEIEGIEAVGMPFFTSQIDIAHARIAFQNGCAAHISASRVAQERLRKMLILQSDAHLTVDYLKQSLLVTRKEGGGVRELTAEKVVRENDPLEMELRAFLQSVRDRTAPVVSGDDGQRALEVALQIVDEIGKPMKRRR
ncbi:MAG: Gfo/Idh/MocA family oxidoreductase [Deltaproteobacteria bacterium]|nr:MAG: Gfo/Idh/MocA family oxidoreductase [Deltaproteobacteria bacterium]